MLATENIRFSYDGKRIFNYPDLVCSAGEAVLITGKSGCGKSTFLHILSGLIRGYEGKIMLNETRVETLTGKELNKFRRHVGIIFQKSHFINSLSIRDNLRISLRTHHTQHIELIHRLCKELNVEELLDQLSANASVGELQRLSLVRALSNNPAVIFADEPTSSLDDEHASIVARILVTQSKKANATLIVVSHDFRIRSLFDQIIELQ